MLAGDCHRYGLGYRLKNRDRAAECYRKGVAIGDLTAMTTLAELLDERGHAEEATALLRQAAEAGDARAQGLYGKRCFNGTGRVAKDPAVAEAWFRKGADGDDARSQNNLASLIQKSQPAQAERLLRRAAERGEPAAMLNLGKVLWEPAARNERPDHDEAMLWFRRAALRGHAPAQFRLGQELVRGIGCDKDPAAARHWFVQAARRGDPLAQLNAGVMFEKGDGGPVSFDDADLWFRKSAEAGNTTAKQYHADILRDRAADLARREEVGELPFARVPSPFTLNALLYTQQLDPNDRSDGLPQYGWRSGWKLFSLLMPDPDTVMLGVCEDEEQTEGLAGFEREGETMPLAELLADGPPRGLIDQTDLGVLVVVLERVLADLGRPEPAWLPALRLHSAVMSGSVDVIRDRAANSSAAARVGGWDALYWALRAHRAEVVELLVTELGADPNAEYADETDPGITALMGAVIAAPDGPDQPVLAALRRGGADPNARTADGRTALLWVVEAAGTEGIWRPAALDWLLANGADPNAANPAGLTPLAALLDSPLPPERKYELAGKLFAAGATVPEPFREPFRAAVAGWHPDGGRAGVTLAAKADPGKWTDDTDILFRDTVAGTEAVICAVTTGGRSSQPYAADEVFSFEAELHAAGPALFVRVVQGRQAIGPSEERVFWYESATAGRAWASCGPAPASATKLTRLRG